MVKEKVLVETSEVKVRYRDNDGITEAYMRVDNKRSGEWAVYLLEGICL